MVALVLHPTVGLATCWQRISDRTSCQGECPMDQSQSPCQQSQSPKPGDRGNSCCQVFGTEPSTTATIVKAGSSDTVTLTAAQELAIVIAPEAAREQYASDRSVIPAKPSLQALYGVFLI
jgi:hypothetical protein